MPLPNIAIADIDVRKLTDYVLNVSHPEGRHKARVFLLAPDVTASDAKWLAGAILAGLPDSEAVVQRATNFGADLPG